MSDYDVAVVGRGAIGSAAALAFARAGRQVALVGPIPEGGRLPAPPAWAQPRPTARDWDPRVYALSPASRVLLTDLGVWQLLDRSRIAPVYDMRIYQPGAFGGKPPPEVHLDAYAGRVEALAWIIENREIQAALDLAIGSVAPPGKVVRVDAEVQGLVLPMTAEDRTPSTLTFQGGGSLSANLVIAADGTASRLRDLAGIRHEVRDYEQMAIVGNFEAELPHRDCAWQWFGDSGVVALLPLPSEDLGSGGSRVSLVWSAPAERAASTMRHEGESLAERVRAMTGSRLGSLRPITPPASFPLRAVHCSRVIRPSFILIGDAAHAIHPMAGQGMNLGFGDVRGLMVHLMAQPGAPGVPVRPPDWFDLRRYERSRREPVAAMQLALEGLHRAFGTIPTPVAGLRDVGWSIVARSSWLRRQMIRHAVS